MDAALVSAVFFMMAMTAAVRTGFRFEGRQHRRQCCAEAAQHVFQHMIRGKAQKTVADLHWNVAVAEVIGGFGQCGGISADDVDDLLGFSDDFDNATVATQQVITTTQDFTTRQQQPGIFTGNEFAAQPAFLPQVKRQLQLLFGRCMAGSSSGFDFNHQNRK